VSAKVGLHHFRHVDDSRGEAARIHLRVDPDGAGTLIVNANRVVHLNPTATEIAHMILEGKSDVEVVRELTRAYAVSRSVANRDVPALRNQLRELIRPDGACPVHELSLETVAPFSARPSAPYRMDLAVTYRCNNACAHCYNARPRQHPELPTAVWFEILDRLWSLGVPHVVFTGGEATLRNDLPELIAHAEGNGQITGLNTNGRRLADREHLRALVDAGLDHVQITLESSDESIHDGMMGRSGAFRQTVAGLRNALDSRLFVMTNTTMLQTNRHTIGQTLDFLQEVGVPTVGLNALIYSGRGLAVGTGLPERELQPLLDMAIEKTEQHGQTLIWYTPTQYCAFDPTQANLGVKGCTAALYSMCIESDGKVLPCQSYYHPVGDFRADAWDSIWNHELCTRLRERAVLPTKCHGCPIVAECGGGCPLRFEMSPAAVLTEVA